MGGLRRTATESLLPTSIQDIPLIQNSIQQEIKEASDCLDIGCSICRISFQYDIPALPELGHLKIKFNSNAKAGSSEDITRIKALVNQVQNSGVYFVTTFDFREERRPDMRLLGPALAEFSDPTAKTWARRSLAIALVTEGNVFSTVANGFMANLVALSGLNACPMVMCHQDTVAEEFFKAVKNGDTSGSSFVSVAGLRDVGSGCYSFVCPWSPASQGISREPGAKDTSRASVEAPGMAMHTLDNGDVRVIQSPPSDLMVLRMKVGIGASADAKKTPDEKRQKLVTTCENNSIEGVFFKCTSKTLKSLNGISFHLGELVIDADSESCFQRGEHLGAPRGTCNNKSSSQRCSRKNQHCSSKPYSHSVAPKAWGLRKGGCFAGARVLFSMICSDAK